MKKQVIALAVAAAVVAPAALAQSSSVTVYGRVNVGMTFDKDYNQSGSNTRVDNMGSSSRLGFRGTEDLGNGLKAIFQIETTLTPDNPTQELDYDNPTGTVAGGNGGFPIVEKASQLGNREAWVGLSGGFGEVRLGRGKTAYQKAKEEFDLGDGPIFLSLHEQDNAGVNSDQGFNGNIRDNASRINNAVFYSVSLGDFDVSADYSFGENKDSSNGAETKAFSGSLKYNFGDFFVIGGVSRVTDRADSATAQPTSGRDRSHNLLGGGWASGPFSVNVAWANIKEERTGRATEKQNFYSIGGTYSVDSKISVYGGYQWTSEKEFGGTKAANNEFTNALIGSSYALSKRTKLIAEYGLFDSKLQNNKSASTLTFGALHRF